MFVRRVCEASNIFIYRYWTAHRCPFWIHSSHTAQSDAMQFSDKESAATAYYYRTAHDVNDS